MTNCNPGWDSIRVDGCENETVIGGVGMTVTTITDDIKPIFSPRDV